MSSQRNRLRLKLEPHSRFVQIELLIGFVITSVNSSVIKHILS